MLQSISWSAYWLIVGTVLAAYYYWWLKKYAVSLGLGRQKPKEQAVDPRFKAIYQEAAAAVDKPVSSGQSQPIEAATPTLSSTPATEPAPPDQSSTPSTKPAPDALPIDSSSDPPFLPLIAGELLKAVAALAETAATENMPQQDIMVSLQRLLLTPPFPHLKGTPFQEKTTEQMLHILTRPGSDPIDAALLNKLWDG